MKGGISKNEMTAMHLVVHKALENFQQPEKYRCKP
jgi:hypothetical protein